MCHQKSPIDTIADPHALLALIASNRDRATTHTAIRRLATLARDSEDAWAALLTVGQAPDPAMRHQAVRLTAEIGQFSVSLARHKQLSQLLLSWLDDDDVAVRGTAITHCIRLPEQERQMLCRAAISALGLRLQLNTKDDGPLFEFHS